MGVWRVQSGKRGSAYGVWVSKPTIDVTSAQPGQFLIDTSSQVFQCVAKGDLAIAVEGSATIPGGSVLSATVSLPGAFSSFSRLVMHGTYYMVQNNGTYYATPNISNTYVLYKIVSGVLTGSVVFRTNGGTGTPAVSFTHRLAYTIFRSQF